MTFTTHQSQIRKIDCDDPNFVIQDKYVMVTRAGFEISKSCPSEYRSILMQAIQVGWLKPFAHVTERELIFMGLSK